MAREVEGFAGPLRVEQFKGGQSSPTYKLITPGRDYVLRRKPAGPLLPGAHAVDREYRVITALRGQGFPVAETYGLCLDETVIGTAASTSWRWSRAGSSGSRASRRSPARRGRPISTR